MNKQIYADVIPSFFIGNDNGVRGVMIKGAINDELLDGLHGISLSEIEFGPGIYNDLSPLKPWLGNVKSLSISGTVTDKDTLELFNNIEDLNLRSHTFPELDFSKFPKLKRLQVYYAKKINESISELNLQKLRCNNWIEEDLSLLQKMDSLTELWMVDSRKLISLNGLENNHNLTTLEIDSANKLEDISAFNQLTNISALSLHGCKSISNYEPLQRLNKLIYLCIVNKGSIPSLDFIRDMKDLQNIVIRAEILDKNLQHFLDLPNLRSFRFTRKSGYNLTQKQLTEHIMELWNGDIPDMEWPP